MGTKHDLAERVSTVVAECRPGRFVDAFAGMGAVAEAIADRRPIWTNDVQHFAYLAGRCRFADEGSPLDAAAMYKYSSLPFHKNMELLRGQNTISWEATSELFTASEYSDFAQRFETVSNQTVSHIAAYGCFIKTYANGYLSLIQCAEVDSIRYALEILRGQGIITFPQFDWALLALGHAVLKTANTTGHFAQYLRPNESNYRRVRQQFSRSVYNQWLVSIDLLKPVGTPTWRRNNLSTRGDCDSLLSGIAADHDIGVVYCDPPYTDDQYSRYYHLWETLVLYDYPVVTGIGRYRIDRYTTGFSLKGKVKSSFRKLVGSVAAIGADLVLSYPSNGLLHETGQDPLDLIREVYPNSEIVARIEHSHSTMGASKGNAKASVAEYIYLGRA